MTKTVIGLFDTFMAAQNVVQDLVDSGYRGNAISIIATDARSESAHLNAVGSAGGTSAGLGTGAVSGTVVGSVLGLLVGTGLLSIPGIGPVLAAGPLASALGATALGAGIGAAAGGLIGSLISAGVPEEEAQYYAEGVRRGGTLIAVNADEAAPDQAYAIMRRHGAVDIQQRGASWRGGGWTHFDPAGEPYRDEHSSFYDRGLPSDDFDAATRGLDARGFDDYEDDFRRHYHTHFGMGAYPYEYYNSVYRYGYNLATEPRYTHREWDALEPEARNHWEENNPNTWGKFKDTIRYAWEKVRAGQ